MIKRRQFRPGDLVVYRKTKHAPVPGPRATAITPAQHGNNYTYNVDKFWVIDRIQDDGLLLLRTRTGKMHSVRPNDPNLRHAGVVTRLLYGDRFPSVEPGPQQSDSATSAP